MSRTLLLLTSICAITLAGCSGDKDSGGDDVGSGVVFAGWDHTWGLLSHRVRVATVVVDEDGSATTGMIGGDFSTGDTNTEYATYAIHQNRVEAPGLVIAHGKASVVTQPDGRIDEVVTIEASGLSDAASVTAALRGFHINTDIAQGSDYPSDYDPALGYCTNGFGFAVGEPSVSGNSVSIPVTGEVRWGPAGPEDPIDRSDMNGAIPFAQTEVEVYVTIIGHNGTETTASGSGSVDYPNGTYSDQPPLTQTDLGLSLDTPDPGFPVLRGFDLGLSVVGATEQGEYIRSYAVELTDGDPLSVSTEMTNSSLVETASIAFAPSVDVGWISLGADGVVEPVTMSGEHDVGTIELDPAGEQL